MSNFDDIFKAVQKKISGPKGDSLSSQHKSGDLTISSHIPFSILTGVPELDYNIARPGWPAGRVIELFGFEHSGKMQSLDSLVSTPKGFKRMGEISVGDEVSDPYGGNSTVLGVYPQGKHLSYEITFKDGRTVTSGAEHLWKVYSPNWKRRGNDGWKVVPLKEIIKRQSKSSNYSFHVQLPDPVYKEEANLPIDPYIFGLFLGDGGFTTNSLTFTNPEPKIIEAIREKLQPGYRLSSHKGNPIQYNIAGNGGRNYYKTILTDLGLLNTYSYSKFIPQIYMEASASQRWALFQGLMDTDGSGEYTSLQYHTSSKQLAYDFQTLVWSLGGTAFLSTYDRKNKRTEYRINIRLNTPKTAFRHSIKRLKLNERKRQPFKIKIINIESLQTEEMQCIKVSNPEGLYLTDEYIVTHNTTLGYHAIAEAQRMGGGGYFIDTEKSWDEKRAIQCGVDPDLRLRIMDCDSIEAVFRSILTIIDAKAAGNNGKPFVIVVDSVTGTATEFMKKHEMGKEERLGQDARAIRGGMRRIMPELAKAKVNLFMINHAIATCATFKFAKQSEAAGGHAIKLFSTVRVNLTHGGWITEGEKDKKRRIGQKIKMRIEKLKGSSMSEPEIEEVALYNTHGFDTLGSLLIAGCKTGWVKHKKGSQDYAISDLAGDEDIDFSKDNWENIVNDRGGLRVAYREFIDWCMEKGIMERWGG